MSSDLTILPAKELLKMKKFDPSIIFWIFGAIFISEMLGLPLILVGIVAMMVFRGVSQKKQAQGRQQQRGERTDRRYQQRRDRTGQRQQAPPSPTPRPKRKPRSSSKANPYKNSGVKKFKDYDYEGAIEDFEKALQINEDDISVHFNLACAYSLMEDKNKSMYHLDNAVSLGFKDLEKIKTHDALAYLRIQDEFEAFQQNNYRLSGSQAKTMENSGQNTELLEQLQKLAELRQKGLLTEEEFVLQKKKLLG